MLLQLSTRSKYDVSIYMCFSDTCQPIRNKLFTVCLPCYTHRLCNEYFVLWHLWMSIKNTLHIKVGSYWIKLFWRGGFKFISLEENQHINQSWTAHREDVCTVSFSRLADLLWWLITLSCHEPQQSPTSSCRPCQCAKLLSPTYSRSLCNTISDAVTQHSP